ncbi:MAG TPA: hypothetical protein VFV58_18585 [Blastocatellia bacterium]|nr:hypothetical protein [Blastocatellia bacterium]
MSSGIHIKPSREGLLHENLGVPQGQRIPAAKLEAAKHSSDPAIRRRANFAINAKGFSHKRTNYREAFAGAARRNSKG